MGLDREAVTAYSGHILESNRWSQRAPAARLPRNRLGVLLVARADVSNRGTTALVDG